MLEYNLDLREPSHSRLFTADEAVRLFPFYLTELGHFWAGPDYFTRRDGKAAALILYTRAGQGVLEWKGQSCTLSPGSAVIIYCDSFHAYSTAAADEWELRWAHLNGTGLSGYAPLLMERLTPVRPADEMRMDALFDHLEQTDPGRGVLARAKISQWLGEMLLEMLGALDGTRASGSRAEVAALADFIRGHLTEALGMEDFQRVANLSRYHLIRLFRQQMGVPPYRYLHQCRIQRAQELLRASDATIAEIGERVGYSDPVNFIRHFRALTGLTPAKYRKESIRWVE